MIKKRVYLYAVVAIAVAVAAVFIASYPQFARGNQAQEIVPANVSTSGLLCPNWFNGQTVSGIVYANRTDARVFNLSKSFQDFVIAPGSSSYITYKIYTEVVGGDNATATAINVTNGFYLIHTSHRTVKENVTQFNVTLTKYANGTFVGSDGTRLVSGQTSHFWIINGTSIIFPNKTKITLTNDTYFIAPNDFPLGNTVIIGYKACYPGTCYAGGGLRPPEFLNISFDNYSHLGINISFSPKSELVYSNNIAYTNLTIAVAPTALPGTYLLSVFTTNEVCEGPFAYLTIGTVPYSGNAPSIGII